MKLFNEVIGSYLASNYKSRHLGTFFGVQIASLRGFILQLLSDTFAQM
jgi:hypothetical protein